MKKQCTKKYLSLLFVLSFVTIYAKSEAPDLAEEYYSLGESFKEQKKFEKAIEHYKRAIKNDPSHFKAMFNCANTLYHQGKKEEALEYYQKALSYDPKCSEAYHNAGVCLIQLKRSDDALAYFRKAVKHSPTYTKAHLQLGALLKQKKMNEEAKEVFEDALKVDTDLFKAHYELGRLYRDENSFDESVAHFRAAMKIDSTHSGAILELANTLNMLEFEHANECLQLYKKALEINPHQIVALYNFGYTLKKLGHIQEAVEVYDKVLEKDPNYALARFSRAASYLMLGDFERGWPEYEWRWKAYHENAKKFDGGELWDGSDPSGKRILVYAEQGLGDTVQFVRYCKVLKDKGAFVIFQTQGPLKDMLSRCPYIDLIVSRRETLPHFDYQIALMSLPMILKTRVDTIPNELPYLYSDPRYDKIWAKKLSSDTNFKIGICWQGNSNYSTQFLKQVVAAKSVSLELFSPITKMDGVSVYSLQKVTGTDQLNKLTTNFKIHRFGENFDNEHGRFMDTLSVMKNIDLVISIDTSICHVAGGLGVPTWTLLPTPADWRWFVLDEWKNKTPWYPGMRLFRQETPGDWQSVIYRVAEEIKKLIQNKHHTTRKANAKKTAPLIDKALPLSLLIDQLSMISIKKATKQQYNEVDMHNQYTVAVQKYPEIKELRNKLQEINRELCDLEQELHANDHSVFDEKFAHLARQTYYAFNQKKQILRTIEQLEKPY